VPASELRRWRIRFSEPLARRPRTERAAIIIAVIVAIVFAAAGAAAFDFHGVNFTIGESTSAQEEVSPGERAAQAYEADRIEIDAAAAIVRVKPEDRADISIAIVNPGRVPMPDVRAAGGQLTINGRLQGRILSCRADGGVDVLGYGGVAPSELPVITVLTPRALNLDLSGALMTEIGPAESARLDLAGCGETAIGDVAGALDVDSDGSGDLRAARAGTATLDLAGSGDMTVGAVAGALAVDLDGSGTVEVEAAQSAEAEIAGSGQVKLGVIAGALTASIRGSGDVVVREGRVTEAELETMGSGDVDAAGVSMDKARAEIRGSGDMRLGRVGALEVSIMGSGDVRVASGSTVTRQEVMGSGDVVISP
jgi:hypothetical protein